MNAKNLIYTLFFFLIAFTSCEGEDRFDYTPVVQINFETPQNLVTADKGANEFTVRGKVVSSVGIKSFYISTANASTGAAGSVIDGTQKVFDAPVGEYEFSYTISDLSENKAIKISAKDANGDDYQKNFVVQITPAVIFSEYGDKKIESSDKLWGVFYAEWLYGRVYKSREGSKYADEINIGMQNQNGQTVLISPSKHELTFGNARKTTFSTTEWTVDEFNAVSRIDASVLDGFNPTSEYVVIEKDKVYAYMTQDGKKGVIYVQNMTGNPASEDDTTVTATIKTKLQAK